MKRNYAVDKAGFFLGFLCVCFNFCSLALSFLGSTFIKAARASSGVRGCREMGLRRWGFFIVGNYSGDSC